MICKYANLLGIPGKGIHKIHIGGVAIVDLLLTLGLALLLSLIPKSPPLTIWIIILLLLSIIIHNIFCTKTSVSNLLNSNSKFWSFIITLIILIILIIIFRYLNINK